MQVLSFISIFKASAVNLTEAMSPPSTTPANGELSFPSSEYLKKLNLNTNDFHSNLHNLLYDANKIIKIIKVYLKLALEFSPQ